MKTIGLIGGMSWESSIDYYRILNELVQARLGGLHSAKCIMYSVDFGPIEAWMRENKWDMITKELAQIAIHLENSGADMILICTNTMHKMFDAIQAHVKIPLYHIADAAGEKIQQMNLKKVGLLGTRYTMEEDFYQRCLLEKYYVEVVVPEYEDREVINQIIFEELVKGKITIESKQKYQKIIQKLIDAGAQGIVLGCTEIPLLIKPEDSPVPTFDTTFLHAEYALNNALKIIE